MNDTHLHAPLKAKYRELETKLMLAKLREFPNKVPSPSRDEMMVMLQNATKSVTIDKSQAF